MSKAQLVCCVLGCLSKPSPKKGIHLYRFPGTAKVRKKWIDAVSKANSNGAAWVLQEDSRICNRHFIGGKKSPKPSHPAFYPTIFTDSLVKDDPSLNKKTKRTRNTKGKISEQTKDSPKNGKRRKKKTEADKLPDVPGTEAEDAVFDKEEPEEIIVEPEIKQHLEEIDVEPEMKENVVVEATEEVLGPELKADQVEETNGDKYLVPEDPEATGYANSLTFFFCGEGSLYYTCFQCGRRFTSMVFLRRHEEKHFTLPFSCGFCSRAFKLKSSLLNHTAKYHQNV